MNQTAEAFAGPSLPGWLLFPATAFFAAITLYVILRTPGRAGRYLLFACWFRYALSALHGYTYREAMPGVTWIALASVLTVVIGLLVLDVRRFFTRAFVPTACICGWMVISGLVNHDLAASIESIVRFIFFTVLCVAVWQALESSGPSILFRLLIVFAPPIFFQVASIALGIAKSGEIDGSTSYIGGFFHEQPFSLILATCFLVAIFAPGIGRLGRLALSVTALVGIYLANYRTTIVAVAPLGIMQLLISVPRAFKPSQRSFVLGAVAISGAVLMTAGLAVGGDRFADLKTVATQGTNLIQPPESFSSMERHVLSARPYIWSNYLYAYAKAPPLQRVVGFGPDSWVGKFPQYAHNTLISFLYELGVVGVVAILWLWLTMFRLALRSEPGTRGRLVAAHVSFFLLNMATMPHWQIEGNIFYAILCGYTIAKARRAMLVQTQARAFSGPPAGAAMGRPAPVPCR